MTPKLLVSVRDRTEALAALAGGCDVLDVKEPRAGALGRASWSVIADVVAAVRAHSAFSGSVSAALGELSDWSGSSSDDANDLEACSQKLDFVKLGLAHQRGNPKLADDFVNVVARFQSGSAASLKWVAVAYADWSLADAPAPNDVLTLMDDLRDTHGVTFGGLLVDTYTKSEQRLLDFITEFDLAELQSDAHARGLQFAVAGRLRAEDLPRVLTIEPDIVAVRSAVCGSGNRMNAVTTDAVAAFKKRLPADSAKVEMTSVVQAAHADVL